MIKQRRLAAVIWKPVAAIYARKRLRLDILLEVLILFIISVVCLVALIGVGVAMVRHVRAGQRRKQVQAPPAPSFEQHLHAAREHAPSPEPRQVPHQRVESISSRKQWNKPSEAVEIAPRVGPADKQTHQSRRSQSIPRHEPVSAEDNAYGDLTDPHPSRPLRIASGRTASGGRY
ncbi:MAG: hypothetical protein PW789_06670 [Edaphobacter sp.]|uniref:hypothetical protein n=1 Tax=Edaphobacter sp. TaxID=1934404 RepID=UPI00238DBAB0|nr:hypothetical protein [Edaphobacter sp.]MDE1176278.1 hypothetical protein [Edaphobacter sp.]